MKSKSYKNLKTDLINLFYIFKHNTVCLAIEKFNILKKTYLKLKTFKRFYFYTIKSDVLEKRLIDAVFYLIIQIGYINVNSDQKEKTINEVWEWIQEDFKNKGLNPFTWIETMFSYEIPYIIF